MKIETLDKANKNRKSREEKLKQYEHINWIYGNTADDDILMLDINCDMSKRIYPTIKEFKFLLRNMRDRLDIEISELDKEFESL